MSAETSSRFKVLIPYALLAPALTYMAVFVGYPLIEAVGLAFEDPSSGSFSLVNFETLARDFHFWEALKLSLIHI